MQHNAAETRLALDGLSGEQPCEKNVKSIVDQNISGLSCAHSQICHFSFKSDVTRTKLLA